MVSLQGFLWLIGLSFVAATSGTARTSLLQVKSKAHRESVSLGMQSNSTARLAEYSKFTEELLAKYGQVPGQEDLHTGEGPSETDAEEAPDEDEQEAVRVVLEFIEDIFGSLESFHNDDVTLALRCSKTAIFDSCAAEHWTDDDALHLREIDEDVVEKSDDHIQCRSDAQLCYQNLKVSCPDYNNYRKDQGAYSGDPKEASLPTCVRTTPENAAFSDVSIQTGDENQLKTFEDCLRQTKLWLDPLYRRYKDCVPQADDCAANEADCTAKQNTFENAHCLWSIEEEGKCFSVNDCGQTDTDQCNKVTCPNIRIRDSARNADHETGQRLVCLLHVIFGKPKDVHNPDTEWEPRPSATERPAALKACKDKNYLTEEWATTCDAGVWEAPDVCNKQVQQTCSAGFQQKWYTDKGLELPCVASSYEPDGCTWKERASERRVDSCELDDESMCKQLQ